MRRKWGTKSGEMSLYDPYLPDVKAVPFAAPKVESVTANGIKKAAKPSTLVPKV